MQWYDRLKQLRKERKLTQAQLEEISGISQEMISALENNNRSFTQPTLDALLTALNYTYRDLFCDKTKEELEIELKILQTRLEILTRERERDTMSKGHQSGTPTKPARHTGQKTKAG